MADEAKREVEKAEEIESAIIDSDPEDVFELNLPIWAIVSFESCVNNNLTYAEAFKKLQELRGENISGLCIVTNEAAARISNP